MGKRKKSFVIVAVTILTLFLELLPYGAVLTFAHLSPDLAVNYYKQRFSYFDPIVFGYGNFAPLVTAALTCVLAVISVINLLVDKSAGKTVFQIVALAAFLISLAPLLTDCYSALGGIISTLLLVSFGISLLENAR